MVLEDLDKGDIVNNYTLAFATRFRTEIMASRGSVALLNEMQSYWYLMPMLPTLASEFVSKDHHAMVFFTSLDFDHPLKGSVLIL